MSTLIDQYGREIDVQTSVTTEGVSTVGDVYTFEGVALWLPAGTPENVVLQTIEAMAPAWWVPPAPEEHVDD